MPLEESQLASGAIRNPVHVRPARQHLLRIADANAHAVIKRLDFVLLGRSVALDIQNFEWNDHRQPAVILVARRKIAKDAALDLLALDLDDDRFDYKQRAIRVDRDIACEIEDAFLRHTRGAAKRKHERTDKASHSDTCTAARSSVSKNAALRKASRRATMMSGNVCRRVTYCLTAPL